MRIKPIYQYFQLFFTTDIFKYLVAGVLSVILEFFILVLMVERFKINYLVANFFSFTTTNIFNYALSRLWVFGKSDKRIRHEVLLFFFFSGIGLVINQFVMWLLVYYSKLAYKLAKLVAVVIVVVWNFWSKKFLIFSTSERADQNMI